MYLGAGDIFQCHLVYHKDRRKAQWKMFEYEIIPSNREKKKSTVRINTIKSIHT